MSEHGTLSIGRIARIMPMLIIILIVINISAVSLIGWSYFRINTDDKDSSEYFRKFNSYALIVAQSGASPSEEIIMQYEELSDFYHSLSRSLTDGTVLLSPEYTTDAAREVYSTQLRSHAILIRENLSNIVDSGYLRIGIMLGISLIASLGMFIMVLKVKTAMVEYNSELLDDLSYLEKILTYEAAPQFTVKMSRIDEVRQLNEAVYRISNDVGYNRKLIDTSVHGNLDQTMSDLYASIKSQMPCDRIALAFVDIEGGCTAETAVTQYNNPRLTPGFREPLSNTSLTSLMQNGKPRIINDLEEYSSNRKVSYATQLIMEEGLKASITVPMMFDGKCLGFFFVSSLEKNVFNNIMMNYISRVINLMKQKFYIEYLLQEVISETSNAFVGLMEEKDNETSDHIIRMSQYSYITARSYHMNVKPLKPRFMREILWYAPLHDIGKVGTPDAILLKEGPLTADEMKVMRRHVDSGISVIRKMNEKMQKIVSTPLMQTAVDIIAGHHEKFDGSGYPRGISGEDIPLAGRIVAMADVFDALTSKRPYKEAFSIETALSIIEGDMKNSFDPEVVSAFKLALPEVRRVYSALKEV